MTPKEILRKGIIAGLLVMFLAASSTLVFAEQSYSMTGKITAIEIAYNTVVIQVPMGESKLFTVAGPLAEDAKLMKGNAMVTLDSFEEGQRVTVKFHSTSQGHVIDRLVLR